MTQWFQEWDKLFDKDWRQNLLSAKGLPCSKNMKKFQDGDGKELIAGLFGVQGPWVWLLESACAFGVISIAQTDVTRLCWDVLQVHTVHTGLHPRPCTHKCLSSKVSIQVKASHPCDIQETWHTVISVDVDSLFSLIFYGIRVAGREEIIFKYFGPWSWIDSSHLHIQRK